ncbi:ATP-dependent DNA helicase RecG [Betaproteobacteria bacterium]|nr:ATP-dependent DNA helicase RecG [Betaproteobacteria bacterium]GHU46754.1 ATP-dependent DNA helicase RecG [Betaproteobacteria bacterium]
MGNDKKTACKKKSSNLQEKLKRLNLTRREDLLLHLPLRYEDETRLTPMADAAQSAGNVQVEGEITDCQIEFRPRRQLVARLADASGALTLRFIHFYPSQQAALAIGNRVRCVGEIRQGFFGAEMVHPRCRVVLPDTPLPQALTPVYPTTAGLAQSALAKLIADALAGLPLTETLTAETRAQLRLPTLWDALHFLHRPPADVAADALDTRRHPAWLRVKLDELLAQQISLRQAYRARREIGAPRLLASGALAALLIARLPFALTAAQVFAVSEINADLAQPYPMQRLLQGDVGAGKTLVAALAACQAIESGWQVAFMAPTEILAEQHYLKLTQWFAALKVEVAWLSGSQKSRQKQAQQAAARTAALVVGTHALIQEGVDYERLGLIIIDEQHRFGVQQRLALRQKGGAPHQLMMSATPIPRTLAMSYCADLDVSVLDELPPGRTPIRTHLARDGRRDEVMAYVRKKVAAGRQVYWVCPLIEESETLQLQTAQDTHAWLTEALPDLNIGLVHGRLKPAEKQAVMAAFVAGELDLLVATTVIEVGVDVPNASLMVIEHAERFGLSQLHQLRGRVGRGAHESACVLLYAEPLSQLARARLKIIFEHTDGFEIARRDLQLRGPGEFIGSRQSGMPLLRYADLEQDADLVETARTLAETMLTKTPEQADAHRKRWLGGREELLKA